MSPSCQYIVVVVFFEEFWVVAILLDQPPFGVTSELVADKNFKLFQKIYFLFHCIKLHFWPFLDSGRLSLGHTVATLKFSDAQSRPGSHQFLLLTLLLGATLKSPMNQGFMLYQIALLQISLSTDLTGDSCTIKTNKVFSMITCNMFKKFEKTVNILLRLSAGGWHNLVILLNGSCLTHC